MSESDRPLPKASVNHTSAFGVDENINMDSIDDWLGRSDVVYRDVRMLFDPAQYEKIGGEADLSSTIEGFKIVPYPYLGSLQSLPVEGAYEGKRLFSIEWAEDGRVKKAVPLYEESMMVMEDLFPKEKAIFLMCGGGGYAGMMKELLLYLGWDPDKLYNIGGQWEYHGNHRVELKFYPEKKEQSPIYKSWNADYAYWDFDRMTEASEDTLQAFEAMIAAQSEADNSEVHGHTSGQKTEGEDPDNQTESNGQEKEPEGGNSETQKMDEPMQSEEQVAGEVHTFPQFSFNHYASGGTKESYQAVILFEQSNQSFTAYQVAFPSCTCRDAIVNYYSVCYVELTNSKRSAEDAAIRNITFRNNQGLYGDSNPNYYIAEYTEEYMHENLIDRLVGSRKEDFESFKGYGSFVEAIDADLVSGATVTSSNVQSMLKSLFEYHTKKYYKD